MNPPREDFFSQCIAEAVRKYKIAIDGLTERQVVKAFNMAIACGDFTRLITQDGRQSVVYIPFAREQELISKIKHLEEQLSSLGVVPYATGPGTAG